MACGAALALTVIVLAGPAAAETAARGRQVATSLCAGCHAVGRTGNSPLPNAPLFRKLADRLDMDELEDRMREGLSSTHRGMPTFRFSRSDARAVRIYLNDIRD
jgi:mono/diheme cytochrome c family protein